MDLYVKKTMAYYAENFYQQFKLLAILAIAISSPIAKATHPASFDCKKAASDVEKTICVNTGLAQLDSRMGKVWSTLLTAFDDEKIKIQMRQNQAAWLLIRNSCNRDSKCIETGYRKRLSELGFGERSSGFSGQYEAKNIGDLTLFPTADKIYLLAIHTADPKQGAWTCEIFGSATEKGSTLLVTVDENRFNINMTSPDTVTIETNDPAAIAQKFCGLNGGFSFSYHRLSL